VVGDRDALDRVGQKHVLRVDQVVTRVLGDLELVAERDRVERARELAVAAEDAAAHVDLVDAGVALAGRDAVLGGVLFCDHANAVRRARRGAERAADALLEPVLVLVQAVPSRKRGYTARLNSGYCCVIGLRKIWRKVTPKPLSVPNGCRSLEGHHEDRGHDGVHRRDRKEHLPAEAHQLVVAEPRERRAVSR
jgi:hypothetical protein